MPPAGPSAPVARCRGRRPVRSGRRPGRLSGAVDCPQRRPAPRRRPSTARSVAAPISPRGTGAPRGRGDEYGASRAGLRRRAGRARAGRGRGRSGSARLARALRRRSSPAGCVATTDMGLDLVRFWRTTDSGLRARAGGRAAARQRPAAHGLAPERPPVRRDRALAARSSRSPPDATGHWRIVAGTSLGAGMLDGDTAAELAASRDGDFLYAGRARQQHDRHPARARRGRGARAGRARRFRRGLAAPPRRRARHPAGRRAALRRGRLAHARPAHRRARPRASPRRGAVADLPAGRRR